MKKFISIFALIAILVTACNTQKTETTVVDKNLSDPVAKMFAGASGEVATMTPDDFAVFTLGNDKGFILALTKDKKFVNIEFTTGVPEIASDGVNNKYGISTKISESDAKSTYEALDAIQLAQLDEKDNNKVDLACEFTQKKDCVITKLIQPSTGIVIWQSQNTVAQAK